MKTKNKTLAVVEIAIVLCSVFLVAMPAIAADQNQTMQKVSASASTITTASEDDYVLGVYGNANEDDTIDMRDLTYVKLIFFGKKPETELADAKYDGKINPLDFIQIKLIIVGREKELTAIDSRKNIKTFKLPITRIIALDDNDGEPLRLLGAEDLVVGVGTSLVTHDIILPKMSKLPLVGGGFDGIDYEKVLTLKPDLFMAPAAWPLEGLEEKLEPAGVQVLLLNFHVITETIEDVRKVGYLIDKVDKAEEFAEFHDDAVDNIRARTDGLSEDKKPRVFIINFWGYQGGIGLTTGKGTKHDYMCNYAGGINIARDLGGSTKVDPEWVLEQNPDIIITCVYGKGQGYGAEDTTKMKAVRDEIMNLPGWDNIKAVKNGNVYTISTDLTQSGLIGFIATAYWAKWFLPDLFEDLDPEAIHQEYVDRFIRIDYDVKNGVFVYPPLGD